LKAIPLKLAAIDQFLTENPEYVGKVVFVVIGITAAERADDYLQTQKAVVTIVKSVNNKFPNAIYYEERKENEMKLVQRVALFYVSDVLMVTAVRLASPSLSLFTTNSLGRDGLNRLPMEYTLTRSTMKSGETTGSREGVVILSEFVSSARVMGGAIIINPWKSDEVLSSRFFFISS
jgi:trehalose-6-phosphate synthase